MLSTVCRRGGERQKPNRFLCDWIVGRRHTEDFLAEMAVTLNLPLDKLREEFIESVRHWTLIEPETGSLVRALRDCGVRVVLATDNVDVWLRWAIPAMGLTDSFDATLTSHERGRGRILPDLP